MFKKEITKSKSSSEQYFEEYRNNVKRRKALQKEISASRKKTESLHEEANQLSKEISAMQRIITQMIDNGWDPVETKLRVNSEDWVSSFWGEDFVSGGGTGTGTLVTSLPGGGTITMAGVTPVCTNTNYNVTGGGTGGAAGAAGGTTVLNSGTTTVRTSGKIKAWK
jgi:hypothetical protein